MLGGDAIPHGRRARPAHHRRRPAGADERAPRADHLPACPTSEGGRAWLLELDTAEPTSASGAPCSGEYEVRAALAGGVAPAAARPRRRRARRPAAPARVARRESSAARRRRRRGRADPAVLDPLEVAAGAWARSATSRAFAGWAAEAGFSVVQLLPVNEAHAADAQPLRRRLGVRARSRSTCRSTPARTSWRPAARRRSAPARAAELEAACGGARWSTGSAVRAAQARGRRRWPSAASCATSGKDRRARGPPARRVHAASTGRGSTTTRCSPSCTSGSAGAGSSWPQRLRNREPGGAGGRPRRAPARASCARSGCSGSSTCSGARRAREASAAGVELMGDLPFMRGRSIRRTSGPSGDLFRIDQRVGTPPDESSPEGQDWGLPVYDWDGARSATTSPGSGRGRCAPASCSAPTASTTSSASTGPTSARTDGEHHGLLAGGRGRRRSRLGETDHAHHAPLGRGDRRGPGRRPAVPAPVAGAAAASPATACCAGRRTATSTAIRRPGPSSRSPPTPPTTPTRRADWYDAPVAGGARQALRQLPALRGPRSGEAASTTRSATCFCAPSTPGPLDARAGPFPGRDGRPRAHQRPRDRRRRATGATASTGPSRRCSGTAIRSSGSHRSPRRRDARRGAGDPQAGCVSENQEARGGCPLDGAFRNPILIVVPGGEVNARK